MRNALVNRKTAETDISLRLCLDGAGNAKIATGVGFLDHMLTLFARHSGFDLTVRCAGDTNVDDHHSTEDIGIALGKAFREALGDKRGIRRFGDCALPMDETLVLAAVDFSGRGALYWKMDIPYQMVGQFDSTLAKEFFIAFATNAGITLHIQQLAGENVHHIIEATFKAVARALRAAVAIDPQAADALPTTKGAL